jgi:hypothetical protein
MAYWDGQRWVDQDRPRKEAGRFDRLTRWAATGGMLLVLGALLVPFTGASAARLGTLQVTMGGTTTRTDATVTALSSSKFTGWGCNFRANSKDYYMVVRGPAPDTSSIAYWVDPFPTNGDGCGSAAVSWSSSGVPGTFEVYVVRSAAGNPWQAQPASNIVTLDVETP